VGCGIGFEGRSNARVDDLPLVSHAGAADDLVLHVDGERAVLDDEREEVGDVARVELAGVSWNRDG
jgi:hypothetical protein